MLSGAQPTCLLIADISGYTSYLAASRSTTPRTSWRTSSAPS